MENQNSALNLELTEKLVSLDLCVAPHKCIEGSCPQSSGLDCEPAEDIRALAKVDPDDNPELWEVTGARWLRASTGIEIEMLGAGIARNRDALLIRGLRRETHPPPAPYSGHSDFRQIQTTLMNLFGIIHMCGGYTFAYSNENHGRIVRDVVARKGAGDEQSSQGWGVDLQWHIDGAYRPLTETALVNTINLSPAPRWLAFAVIYNTQRIPMKFVSLCDVIERLDLRDTAALCRQEFDVHSPASFGSPQVTSGVAILLPDTSGNYFNRFNQDKCFGRTRAARNALQGLRKVLNEAEIQHSIELEPGDVIMLDNWRTLHSRSAYIPRWDGQDRWLVRTYVASPEQDFIPSDPTKPRVWV